MSSSRSVDTQISSLPPVNRIITTHNAERKAIFHPTDTAPWASPVPAVAFNLIYSTSATPVSFNNEADIAIHSSVAASGTLGHSIASGSIFRVVDTAPFDPNSPMKPFMHRTQSLDYGIVIAGEMELILDSGESKVMRVGDVIVQRGVMHAWRNNSETEWARAAFVQLESEKVVVGGVELEEDLGVMGEEMKKKMNAGS